MRVSIVMPVYNKEKYIKEAIESVLNQSYKDFELVIVDDASTDKSINIIKSFKDERIKLIELKKNVGVAEAPNIAIRNSSSDIIMRLDADDISDKYRLEKQLNYMIKNDYDIVGAKFKVFCDEGNTPDGFIRYMNHSNSITTEEDIIRNYTVMPTVSHGTMLYKKSILDRYPLNTDFAPAEDYEQLGRMIKNGVKIGKVNDILLGYRYVINSESHSRANEGVLKGFKIKLDFIYSHYKISEMKSKKFFIWGSKEFAKMLREELSDKSYEAEVKGFIDFDEDLWGRYINGLKIYSPTELIDNLSNDDIILTMWNLEREKIIDFLETNNLKRNKNFFVLS